MAEYGNRWSGNINFLIVAGADPVQILPDGQLNRAYLVIRNVGTDVGFLGFSQPAKLDGFQLDPGYDLSWFDASAVPFNSFYAWSDQPDFKICIAVVFRDAV